MPPLTSWPRASLVFLALSLLGACGCPEGTVSCDGACRRTYTIPECGACGLTCSAGRECRGGTCGCPDGQIECAGGCFDPSTSPLHCGACGISCAGTCEVGVCTCDPPLVACDGRCVDLETSPTDCGECGRACAEPFECGGGTCGCAGSGTACRGACISTRGDLLNCGACGTVCAAGASCSDGACACPVGLTECGVQCVETTDNVDHCGGCYARCLAFDENLCEGTRCVPEYQLGFGFEAQYWTNGRPAVAAILGDGVAAAWVHRFTTSSRLEVESRRADGTTSDTGSRDMTSRDTRPSGMLMIGSTAYVGLRSRSEPEQGMVVARDTVAHTWPFTWTGLGRDVTDIALAPDGTIAIVGDFTGVLGLGAFTLTARGTVDSYYARLDPATRAVVFATSYGTPGRGTSACQLAPEPGGSTYLLCSGSTAAFGGVAGTSSYVLARVDAGGSVLWVLDLPSRPHAVASLSDGVVVTGHFSGATTIAGTPLTAVEGGDVYLATWNDDGSGRWALAVNGTGGRGPEDGAVAAFDDEIFLFGDGGGDDLGFADGLALHSRAVFIAAFDRRGERRWVDSVFGYDTGRPLDLQAIDGTLLAVGYDLGGAGYYITGDGPPITYPGAGFWFLRLGT